MIQIRNHKENFWTFVTTLFNKNTNSRICEIREKSVFEGRIAANFSIKKIKSIIRALSSLHYIPMYTHKHTDTHI